MNISNRRKNQKAFSLIELLTSLVILVILVSVAFPQYQSYLAKSQVARVISESAALKDIVEICIQEGRGTLGIGVGECDPQMAGSNILVGDTQGSRIGDRTGVPRLLSIFIGVNPVIVATFGNNAVSVLTATGANTVVWSRDDKGVWICSSTVPLKYRFPICS